MRACTVGRAGRRYWMMLWCAGISFAVLAVAGCGGGDDEAASAPPKNTSAGQSSGQAAAGNTAAPTSNDAPVLNGTPTEQLLGMTLGESAAAPGRPKSVDIPPAQQKALAERLDVVTKAFAASDAKAITEAVYPGRREHVQELLTNASKPLGDLAKALAAGKLVAATDVMAEYEVVIDGKAYPVVFMNVDDQWYLYTF